MPIPNEIPVGARIVVRTLEGVDPTDHRMKFRDYVGHVRSWDGQKLEMTRDAAAAHVPSSVSRFPPTKS